MKYVVFFNPLNNPETTINILVEAENEEQAIKKDVLVEFNYVHEKKDRYTPKKFTYSNAITLAEKRMNDGRYKNYRYEIYAIDK